MDRARANGRITRSENSALKIKARANRDARMKELLKKGKFPYTPAIMSWVSVKLGKPARLVTETEVLALAKS
jgi:hypothetical protein